MSKTYVASSGVVALATVLAVAFVPALSSAQGNPTGMPNALNVKITNTPLPVQGEVSVGGVVSIKDLNAPTNQPIRVNSDFELTFINTQRLVYTVPDGKRLVVESVTFWSSSVVGAQLIFAGLRVGQFGGFAGYLQINPPHVSASSSHVIQDGAQATRLYFEAGEEIWISASKSSGSSVLLNLVVNGHLVDL